MVKTYSVQEVYEFMKKTSIMSAAFCHQNNKPLSTILLFAIDEDFTMYFATLSSSYKAKAIEENNQISISVWEHKQMLVQANGSISKINDPAELNTALDKIVESSATHEDFWPPVLQISGHDYAVYKIKLSWLRALDLTSPYLVENKSLFTEIKLYE
ncbi:MAG: hypothetical protein COU63_01265 [Candidatus Pacebacteria bacterium CG10_big_fil_rev_8_21_14_0_10_36_11]|nr:MAG: hypothetical protein COU63_01265 [Candidatus Pacebacteria bacterium CG10_big_fil_rev_8_21_14_0_10_36_11]PJC43016.1 MAG: hypothetical protein CO040_01385 [Candidatus Pacebacteria bacterium CG_4_9_14_0_2_um_filter_36_8]